jgi:hypothetical protein
MKSPRNSSKALHITLWVAQVALAAGFLFGGLTKLLQPIEKLAAMWPWASQVPTALVTFTGIADILVALGLLLPTLLRIKPAHTPTTALGAVALMLSASIFHIARGEASVIGVNVVFAMVAVFIAWGRFRKSPIASE